MTDFDIDDSDDAEDLPTAKRSTIPTVRPGQISPSAEKAFASAIAATGANYSTHNVRTKTYGRHSRLTASDRYSSTGCAGAWAAR